MILNEGRGHHRNAFYKWAGRVSIIYHERLFVLNLSTLKGTTKNDNIFRVYDVILINVRFPSIEISKHTTNA